MSLEVSQGRIFCDDQMSKLFWSEVWIIDIPAKLLFVSLSLQLQVEMNGYQRLIAFTCMFASDVSSGRSQYELFIYCFIECGVSRAAWVETV